MVWDGGGNVAPQLLIARWLVERGHEVRVLGHRSLRDRIERIGAAFSGFAKAPEGDSSRPESDLIRDWEGRTPIGAFARTRDNLMFGPALEFAQDVIATAEGWPPDVIAFDYLLLGAGIGAERLGMPSAILVHTPYPLPTEGVPPFGQGLMPATRWPGRVRDKVLARGFDLLFAPGLKAANAARRELGMGPLGHYSEQLHHANVALVLTSAAFDFAGSAELPPNVRYVGPVLDRRAEPGGWDSPWPDDHPHPLVLASFSTTFQGQRDLAERVLAALDGLPVRCLLTSGPALDLGGIRIPPNVSQRRFVPHAAVLRHTDLVITHAGLGTVHAALASAVPLLCIPDGRDQNDTAARVVAAGAGLRARRKVSPRRLRQLIVAGLESEGLREHAGRMANLFAAEDGATRAGEEIEALAVGQVS
ncbi:MAG: nucleotide disphospho-sugar-binding domain-containing protein [Solirubrobacterales bacterium]